MRRLTLCITIVFFWLFAVNHCAIEAAAGIPCTCEDSEQTSQKSCNGAPCFTSQSTLPHASHIIAKKIELLPANLLVFWNGTGLFTSIPAPSLFLEAPGRLVSHTFLLLTSLVSASNAPPVI